MKHLSRLCLPMALLVVGAAEVRGQGMGSPLNGVPFVLVADGAGGYATLTDNLLTVYSVPPLKCHRPVICRIPWATDGENLNDYRCYQRHLAGAVKMAGEVQRIRRCNPDSPIILFGYSAGASVALLAAEILPPGTLERIVLFGPTVSACYDVRRALAATKLGVDSFNVPGDEFLVATEETYGAPYERPGSKLAGNVGFRMADPRFGFAGDPLLCKLRQHNVCWLPTGHFGTVTPHFLARFVVPMIPTVIVQPICQR